MAFTLVELLIAGMIASLVLIATYMLFISNTDQYYRQEQIVQMQETMRFAVEYLKSDLRNAGRQALVNGSPQSGIGDPGYCNLDGRVGVQLFDNESDGIPVILSQNRNDLRPDRLRIMVDSSGATPLTTQAVSGNQALVQGPDQQVSADARETLGEDAEARFEAMYKAGYFLRIASNVSNDFTLVPIAEVDFNGGAPRIQLQGNVCPAVADRCLDGGCLVNPVQWVQYRIALDEADPSDLKTDLVRQVIGSVDGDPIAEETVVVAEYVVDLQVWGTYDTRADGADIPVIPEDPDPTDDVGNWSAAGPEEKTEVQVPSQIIYAMALISVTGRDMKLITSGNPSTRSFRWWVYRPSCSVRLRAPAHNVLRTPRAWARCGEFHEAAEKLKIKGFFPGS